MTSAIAASVLILDRITKVWIQQSLPVGGVLPVIPGCFNLVRVENRGFAFGLFSESSHALQQLLLSAVAIAVLGAVALALWSSAREERWHRWALALLLGGAAGNLWDRLQYGAVTDFLDFYIRDWHWPAFNVADSAITVGALALAIRALSRRTGAAHASQARPDR